MTKETAIKKLIETRKLSTGMLEPLGIPFEFFLRFAQVSEDKQNTILDKLIIRFSE